MLLKDGVQVSLHRSNGGQEMPAYRLFRPCDLPIELISSDDGVFFYPVLKLTSAFRSLPALDALKITVRHNQDAYIVLVDLEKSKTAAFQTIDLGNQKVSHKHSSYSMCLKQALYTGVNSYRTSAVCIVLIDYQDPHTWFHRSGSFRPRWLFADVVVAKYAIANCLNITESTSPTIEIR